MRLRSILALPLCLAFLFASPALLASDASCVDAQAKFLATVDTLPTNLTEFEDYPMVQRRALFEQLDAQTRSEVWREHFDRILTTEDLTKQQARVVELAAEIASPKLFAIGNDDVLWEAAVYKPLEGLKLSAGHAFTEAEMDRLFAQLGESVVTDGDDKASSILKGMRCSCNRWYDGCGVNHFCGGECDYRGNGCGVLWSQPCDGLCLPRS